MVGHFAAQRRAFRRRIGGRQGQHGVFGFAVGVGGWRQVFAAPLAGADQIERAIGRDAVEPRAEARPVVEFAELFVGAEQTVLDYVFGVLRSEEGRVWK